MRDLGYTIYRALLSAPEKKEEDKKEKKKTDGHDKEKDKDKDKDKEKEKDKEGKETIKVGRYCRAPLSTCVMAHPRTIQGYHFR